MTNITFHRKQILERADPSELMHLILTSARTEASFAHPNRPKLGKGNALRGNYTSVLVTDAGTTQQDENAIYCETVDGSPVACFKSQRKTVFVVSDRSEEANLKLAQGITPTVRSFLDKPSPFL